eukprot:TRINITY_DN12064_c0_g1_i2.p1 TRINITY_DN12064_c0_g1~~TRINITY_DN12064_c0_g1_i2.p1  ORF type:complete len:250 (-),score=40.28 TRINITY_DN12064_c0_g1_i2:136-885(-)
MAKPASAMAKSASVMTGDASRVVFIAGCACGLGRELAHQLMGSGAQVVASCRDPEDLQELERSFAGRAGPTPICVQLDASSSQSVSTAMTLLRGGHNLQQIDLVITNPDTLDTPDDSPLTETSEDHLASYFNAHTVGAIRVVQACLPLMEGSSIKKIVAMVPADKSVAGAVSSRRISNAALNMSCRILADELSQQGFTVVALSPGWHARAQDPTRTAASAARSCLKTVSSVTAAQTGLFLGHDGSELTC